MTTQTSPRQPLTRTTPIGTPVSVQPVFGQPWHGVYSGGSQVSRKGTMCFTVSTYGPQEESRQYPENHIWVREDQVWIYQ